MKKDYIMPEIILRQVILEGFMEESIVIDKDLVDPAPDDGWDLGDAESKNGNNKSFDIWED